MNRILHSLDVSIQPPLQFTYPFCYEPHPLGVAAAKQVQAVAEEAKASVPARKWTDADLGALCNQAAVKMGDPSPIKEIIAEYVPEGEVAHSRNIPDEKRDDFAKAIEAKAGIEFAG